MRGAIARAALLLFLCAVPAGAQEDVARRHFVYFGRRLTIEVASPTAGELHVVRGGAGRVEVSGRARDGFVSSALAQRAADRLRLVAVGADHVEYVVVVPEDVHVRVRLPDRQLTESVGGWQEPSSFTWGSADEPLEAAATPAEPGMHRLYLDTASPRVLSLPRPEAIRSVTLRVEGEWFDVAGSRLLRVQHGAREVLEIRPAAALDLKVTVPAGTRDFALRIGGETALIIVDGQPSALCSPVVEQRLEGDRRWFTFTPQRRRLSCPPAPAAPTRRAPATAGKTIG